MRGLTKKPCPGCGKAEYPWRKTDEICRTCKKLIKEALEHRESLKKMTGKMKIAVGEAYHWNKGYLEGDLKGPYHEFGEYDLRSMLLRLMVKLIKELSEKSYDDPYTFKAAIVLKGLGLTYQYDGSESQPRYIEKRVFGLLRGLDRLIRLSLKRSYENGKKEGSSLIRMLASGQTTVEKFQKEVEREG